MSSRKPAIIEDVDSDGENANHDYFYVCVHYKRRSICDQKGDKCLFDLPRNLEKPTSFHDLRNRMFEMKVNPDFGGNSDWFFLLDRGRCVPVFQEAEWRIDSKELHYLDKAEGTVRNPHCVCIIPKVSYISELK